MGFIAGLLGAAIFFGFDDSFRFTSIPFFIYAYYDLTKKDREKRATALQEKKSKEKSLSDRVNVYKGSITGNCYSYPCNDGVVVVAESSSDIAYITNDDTKTVPYSSIISVSIDKTMGATTVSTKNGVVTRAVVGGIIGAATSGTTSTTQEHVVSATVKIHTNDLSCHTLVIPTDSEQTANDVEGIVLALKDRWK